MVKNFDMSFLGVIVDMAGCPNRCRHCWLGSQKMLEKCGFVPYPESNIPEKHYITGEDIIQIDYIYRGILHE